MVEVRCGMNDEVRCGLCVAGSLAGQVDGPRSALRQKIHFEK